MDSPQRKRSAGCLFPKIPALAPGFKEEKTKDGFRRTGVDVLSLSGIEYDLRFVVSVPWTGRC